ncbi:MAG TPA: hypothetical protein PL066_01820 [bacterium]|nr:hypothetical protein [bacterium]
MGKKMKVGKAVVVQKLFLKTDSIYVHHTAIEARQPVGSRGVVAEPVPLHDSQLWFVRMDNGKNAVYHEGELEQLK